MGMRRNASCVMPHAPRIKYICITHDGKKWSSRRPFDDLGGVAEMKEVFTLLKTVARVGERGIISSIKLKPTLGRTILVKS